MKYSIIIPTLNEEKLLPILLNQLIECRNQYEFEIIVSDGGSNDKTLDIAGEFADEIVHHKNGSKQNIAIGRNSGADIAKGDILVFLNGDIELSNPKKFFNYLENSFGNSKFKAMTCSVVIKKAERTFLDRIFLGFYNYYFHLLNVIGVGMGRGECQIVRKNIFNDVKGYNENLAAGEDFDLFKRIRKLGKIHFTHDFVIYESPRRYRKYGHLNIFFKWTLNGLFVLFKNKSLSKQWEPIR